MHYSECKNARAAIVRTIVMKFDTVKSVALPISTSNIINWNRDGNGKIESGFSDIDRIKLLQVLLHADTKTKHLILGCLSLNTEKRVTVICMPAKFCEKKWKTRKITKIIENQKILRDRKKKNWFERKKLKTKNRERNHKNKISKFILNNISKIISRFFHDYSAAKKTFNRTILKRISQHVKIAIPFMVKPTVNDWRQIGDRIEKPEPLNAEAMIRSQIHINPAGLND